MGTITEGPIGMFLDAARVDLGTCREGPVGPVQMI